jgi:hypothetical protein
MFGDGTHNAMIESADIVAERGIFVCPRLAFDYGGAGQSYGGRMASNIENDNPRPYMDAYITGIFRVFKVEAWSDLKGKPARVQIKDGLIVAVGHYLEDRWFSFDDANAKVESQANGVQA